MTSVPPPSLSMAIPRARSEDDLAADVVLSLHRLTKGATLYAADNQAALRQLEGAKTAIAEYGQKTELNPKIFFTDKSVFVGGRLLKAGRNVYGAALELGTILRQYGIDEVAIGHDVPLEDLRKLQTALRDALQGSGESPAKAGYQRIRLRRGQPPGRRDEVIPPEELVIRTYATATIVMRRFLSGLQAGDYRLPIGVRRIAQQLAELSAAESPAFLGTTAIYNAKHEHAGRAVNAALVALAMARQLSDDKRLLARIAMAALMYDVGIPRVAGTDESDLRAGRMLPRVIEDQYEELPASAAATMWAVGGFGDAALQNTVLVYEALSTGLRGWARPAYDGLREPSLAARVVATSRRFNELLSDATRPLTADQALCSLLKNAREDVDRTLVRILASALSLFTTGSLVHLSSGEVAKVVRTSDNPLLFATPVVRPVMGGAGPHDLIDLAQVDDLHITALVELGDEAALDDEPNELEQGELDEEDFDDGDSEESDLDEGEIVAIDIGHAEIDYSEVDDFGDRESWSDLELAEEEQEDDEPDWLADSPPPRAPAQNLAPAEDFAPAPVEPITQRTAEPKKAHARPQSLPAPIPSSGARLETRPRASVAERGGARHDLVQPIRLSPPTPEPKPSPDLDDALRAYLSEESAKEAQPRKVRLRAPKPLAAAAPPVRTPPPRTPPPRTPAPAIRTPGYGLRTPPPRTPPPATPVPRTPLPDAPVELGGRDLQERKPTATGSLKKTPFVHLLVYALDRKLTGTTALVEPGGGTHLVYFDAGVVAKVRTAGLVHPLDKVLRDLGAVDTRTLKRTVLEVEQSGELHGQYLLAKGLVDEATLFAALQWQLLRKVSHLLSLSDECQYAYYDKVNALADYGGPELTPVDPLALIMTGLRLMGRSPLVSTALSKLATQPIVIRDSADIERLRLHADEAAIALSLRASPMPLGDLVAERPGKERMTLVTVYALMITRSLDLALLQKPPVGHDVPRIEDRWLTRAPSAASRSAPPPKTAPFGTKQSGAPATPPPELEKSAKEHEIPVAPKGRPPANVSEPPPASRGKRAPLELGPLTSAPGAAEAAAPRPASRKISSHERAAGKAPASAAKTALDPYRLFKKAKLKLMTGKLDEAEDLVQQAVDSAPDEPEFRATLAWIQAEILGPPGDLAENETSDHYDAQIALLDEACAQDESYAKALFYRAELLRRSGHRERALADYTRVMELDPHSDEAAAQVEALSR